MPSLDSLDGRLRAVEQAVVELATMSKMLRVMVVFLGLSLGVDLQAVI